MKTVLLLFQALLSLLALAVQGQQPSYYFKDIEHARFLAKSKFTCPKAAGLFPDPEDCYYFYMCVRSVGARRRCPGFMKFDSVSRQCTMPWIAVCFDGKTKSTTASTKVTKSVTSSTSDDSIIVCPSFMGTFPHPNDCSKYFSCMLYIPTIKTCPPKQLFDAVKNSCKPEGDVHCGTRKRPAGYTTTQIPLKSSTTISTRIGEKSTVTLSSTIASKAPDVVSKTEKSTITLSSTTTSKPPDIVSKTTETSVPTKEVRPTGPPDHNCDENDVDCIITETGDVRNWFTCPDDMGSYPHPSSDKLFIFCMNGTPSVKKCGVDLVFSKELLTCVNTLYLV